MEIFAFYVTSFEPIKISTHQAPQNDCLNLSFVTNNHMVGKKGARRGRKMDIYLVRFISDQSLGGVPRKELNVPNLKSNQGLTV